MSATSGPDIVSDGLVLCLDAGNPDSYPGSGTTWKDLAGSNSGTLTNSPTYDSENLGGLTFDGSNDYVSTGYDLSWNDTNSASVFVNLTPANNTQNRGFIGKGPSNWEWQLNQRGANLELVYWNTVGSHSNGPITTVTSVFETDTPVSVGIVWNHVDNKHYFYKNGVNIGNNTWTDASINQNRSDGVNIGGAIYAWGLGGAYWTGTIHNVSLYNRALTAQEVLENYNATKARFGLT